MRFMSYKPLTPDEQERNKIIGTMFAAYGQANDAKRLGVYSMALAGIPNELLSKGVKKLLLKSKFMPTIAEIVKACNDIVNVLNPSRRFPDWQEAWLEINMAIRSSEPWHYSHPAIEKTVKTYGIMNLRMCSESSWGVAQAHVRKLYEALCDRYREAWINGVVIGDEKEKLLTAVDNSSFVKAGTLLPGIMKGAEK